MQTERGAVSPLCMLNHRGAYAPYSDAIHIGGVSPCSVIQPVRLALEVVVEVEVVTATPREEV